VGVSFLLGLGLLLGGIGLGVLAMVVLIAGSRGSRQ
jgi:hypothetical protein